MIKGVGEETDRNGKEEGGRRVNPQRQEIAAPSELLRKSKLLHL